MFAIEKVTLKKHPKRLYQEFNLRTWWIRDTEFLDVHHSIDAEDELTKILLNYDRSK